MKRLTACLLVLLLSAALPTVGAVGCAEHYRVDPETGKRYKISDEEYRELKQQENYGRPQPNWRAPG